MAASAGRASHGDRSPPAPARWPAGGRGRRRDPDPGRCAGP
ncbi:hypothetical protein ACFFX0_16775 [Citricoccus parietis]|uniref:Uncharacterized protein n=1 Tax=Citricoccus parietis TaxID=592307 RepID=A0ABV5G1E6_9MICC